MGFDDDKRLYTTSINNQANNTCINAVKILVSTWYKLLLFVVGELELSKCYLYIKDCKFNSKDKPIIEK